jgi:hypothetical protein
MILALDLLKLASIPTVSLTAAMSVKAAQLSALLPYGKLPSSVFNLCCLQTPFAVLLVREFIAAQLNKHRKHTLSDATPCFNSETK